MRATAFIGPVYMQNVATARSHPPLEFRPSIFMGQGKVHDESLSQKANFANGNRDIETRQGLLYLQLGLVFEKYTDTHLNHHVKAEAGTLGHQTIQLLRRIFLPTSWTMAKGVTRKKLADG